MYVSKARFIKKVKGLPFTFPHDINKMLKTLFRFQDELPSYSQLVNIAV
ncbi:Uncharacterised protein [Sphingobacterium multivorum]|uniref:Uncharacterized protein n=1 Tax=Sphingobacterium multivorum TaxID=28454 RepID=A0A2X2IYH9_SPHMU|nr:Uncharacterised protein [Sphingobacterium multivorum]